MKCTGGDLNNYETCHPFFPSTRNPDWSADGTQVIYELIQGTDVDVYIINNDGTNPTQLTVDGGREENPVWGGLR